MAKSMAIRLPDGAAANPSSVDQAVLSPVTPTASLGAIAASILDGSIDPMRVVVDFVHRQVGAIVTTGTDIEAYAGMAAETGATGLGEFILDDDTKKSAGWTRLGSAGFTIGDPAGVTDAERAISKPRKPVMTLSSLISAIEDATATGGYLDGQNVLVLVDQASARVGVIAIATPERLAVLANIASATVQYEQYTPDATVGGAQAFE